VNKISGYKYIQIFQFISFNEHINGKYTEEHREIRKKKIVIFWAPVLIFLTNHSSHKYSVCHKLLNMENIYMLPTMVI